MNTPWPLHVGIWRHAVLGERRQAVLTYSAIAFVFFILAALATTWQPQLAPAARLAICTVPQAALGLFCWMRYVSGAVRQNTPANAQLAPRLCRSVRLTTIAAWFLTLLPMALLASASAYPLLAFLTLSMMVTALGMARGGRAVGTGVYILLVVTTAQVSSNPGFKEWLSQAPVLAMLALLSAAMAWDALRSVFPHGGDHHWKLLRAQDGQRVSTDLIGSMRHSRTSGHRRWLFGLMFKHDLRPGARADHLLLHALGPNNHRFDFLVPLVTTAGLALLLKLALATHVPASGEVPLGIIYSFAAPLILLQGLTFNRLEVSMKATAGEQVLVRLAPRAPAAASLGRSVARQLLAICVTEWFVCGAALLGISLLFRGGARAATLVATMMGTSLAMTGWALRDYAGKDAGNLGVVIMQTIAMGAGCVGLLLLSDQPLAWGMLLALMLAAALAIVRGRWNTMAGAPAPFPAGRG